MANSASIRYAQLFPANITHSIYCNRGTSGIEGSTSTAIGSAVQAYSSNKQQTVFITGDLSFFYDINALWQKYTPESFRIIIVNNQGGGIFRILPGAKEVAPFETYLETPHERNAERMAKEFGFEYDQANDINTVNDVLKTFYNPSSVPRILEILTPNTRNDIILNEYFDYLTTHKAVMVTKN
jgi:2-succinyl-5-enolpyruvyl-6-hydroxy-3-cyclohexene-1-carboxylate synthase